MKKLPVVSVGIADHNVVKAPNKIRTSGLGSCVGVVIYDQFRKIAGLVHIMLPDSSLTRQKEFNKFKYADTGIDALIDRLVVMGARKSQLKAKIAGGAQMFQFQSTSDMMRIGPRNVEAVKERLQYHHIPVISSDTGGSKGRTIEFDPETAKLKIRTVNQGEKYI